MTILRLTYIAIILSALGSIFTQSAYAGEYKNKHHRNIITNNTTVTQYGGVSAAMAMSAITFDQNVKEVQIGIGGAYYEYDNGYTENGVALGIGKTLCLGGYCGVVNGVVATSDNGSGGAIGATWRF